jgi:hypothetical protein
LPRLKAAFIPLKRNSIKTLTSTLPRNKQSEKRQSLVFVNICFGFFGMLTIFFVKTRTHRAKMREEYDQVIERMVLTQGPEKDKLMNRVSDNGLVQIATCN